MATKKTTLTRPQTQTIPGYRIQPMLPITFYLDGTVEKRRNASRSWSSMVRGLYGAAFCINSVVSTLTTSISVSNSRDGSRFAMRQSPDDRLEELIEIALMFARTERTHRRERRTTMAYKNAPLDREQAIPGYRIQPMLPIGIPYLGIKIQSAEFRVYPSEPKTIYVEARAIIGTLTDAYTIVLSIDQALQADVIETI